MFELPIMLPTPAQVTQVSDDRPLSYESGGFGNVESTLTDREKRSCVTLRQVMLSNRDVPVEMSELCPGGEAKRSPIARANAILITCTKSPFVISRDLLKR